LEITANQIGLTRITALVPVANTGYVPVWDKANSKLKVFYGDNNNNTDGPLIEIPNTTDISTVTFTVIAFGV
jgi:hypothetical protein